MFEENVSEIGLIIADILICCEIRLWTTISRSFDRAFVASRYCIILVRLVLKYKRLQMMTLTYIFKVSWHRFVASRDVINVVEIRLKLVQR